MKAGDTIRIYPHGDPAKVADATVVIASANQLSLALEFAYPPPFTRLLVDAAALGINRATWKVTMLLMRTELNGRPWGPWVELKGGGHYEIEECSQTNA